MRCAWWEALLHTAQLLSQKQTVFVWCARNQFLALCVKSRLQIQRTTALTAALCGTVDGLAVPSDAGLALLALIGELVCDLVAVACFDVQIAELPATPLCPRLTAEQQD